MEVEIGENLLDRARYLGSHLYRGIRIDRPARGYLDIDVAAFDGHGPELHRRRPVAGGERYKGCRPEKGEKGYGGTSANRQAGFLIHATLPWRLTG